MLLPTYLPVFKSKKYPFTSITWGLDRQKLLRLLYLKRKENFSSQMAEWTAYCSHGKVTAGSDSRLSLFLVAVWALTEVFCGSFFVLLHVSKLHVIMQVDVVTVNSLLLPYSIPLCNYSVIYLFIPTIWVISYCNK